MTARHFFNLLLIVFTTLLMGASPSAWAAPGFNLASLAYDGTLPSSYYNGDHAKITPNGRFVLFRSQEANLVTPPTSGGDQIFLRDRQLGTTELISVNNNGEFGNSFSEQATISDDGCRVAFRSGSTNLVAGYVYSGSDVFLRDRCTQPMQTRLVTLNTVDAQSNAASFTPAISGNGRYVAFNSYSTDLVQEVTRSNLLYLRDLDKKTTILLSRNITTGLGEQAWNPSLSFDGSRIAFTAASHELVSTPTPAGWNVYLYDASFGTSNHIRLVSSDSNGIAQDNNASGDQPQPGISADGHYVSFYSNSQNLVFPDTNGRTDVFVKNVDTNEIWLASNNSFGAQTNVDTRFDSTLSMDGTWVTFYSDPSNLTNNQGYGQVLTHNIHTGETKLVSGINADHFPAISGDQNGCFVANFWGDQLDQNYPTSTGVFVYNRYDLPGAPAISSVKPGSGRVAITVQPPNNTGGSAIASYTATCSASGYPNVTASSTTTTIVAKGLQRNVRYACTVTATNSFCPGPATPATSVVSKTDLTPILMLLLD